VRNYQCQYRSGKDLNERPPTCYKSQGTLEDIQTELNEALDELENAHDDILAEGKDGSEDSDDGIEDVASNGSDGLEKVSN
jgi:hypothetical protein